MIVILDVVGQGKDQKHKFCSQIVYIEVEGNLKITVLSSFIINLNSNMLKKQLAAKPKTVDNQVNPFRS